MTALELRVGLTAIAQRLTLRLTAPQTETLLRYLELLIRWNATYNLTAVRDARDMLTQHLADCLGIVQPLRRQVGELRDKRILDVGSGAGLPGVILGVTEPATNVVCIDKVGKKAAFLRQVVGELGLRNLRVEHARIETWRSGEFDVIVSRAFASLSDFITLTRPHLAPAGTWLAMKGRHPANELLAIPAAAEAFHVEPLSIPGLNAQRCLVWMRQRQ